jgi:glycerol-3-phosphate acyltransferase PlsY
VKSTEVFILYGVLSFIFGSIMFSYFIGKFFLHIDIRETQEDHNPGAVNLFKTGRVKWAISGLVMDVLKGYLPIFIAIYAFNFTDAELVVISIAPILGHTFSPFLKFRGGKAIATTIGSWTALTELRVAIIIFIVWLLRKILHKDISDDNLILFSYIIVFFYLIITRIYGVYYLYIWAFTFLILLRNLKFRHETIPAEAK